MKQGINTTLRVHIDYDLSEIEQVEFIFKQNEVKKIFIYPSENVTLEEDNTCGHVICIHWTRDDTFMFNCKDYVRMDTRIYINGCDDNPETPIIKLKLNETLFDE